MADATAAFRHQLERQVTHWSAAAADLGDLGRFASPSAWSALESYLGTAIRASLGAAVERLLRQSRVLTSQLDAAETRVELGRVQVELIAFRRRYLAVEVALDFFGDAINTRVDAELGAYLRACDALASTAMRAVLDPIGQPAPPVLTYVDRGLGASILKAGLRLWDGRSLCPAATIKIARHNLARPSALLHETGHQVAHITGWVDELAARLGAVFDAHAPSAALWSGWASEVAADAFAFVHGGYAAVATLHDVLAGEPSWVLRVDGLDPHPAGYVRVLLAVEMCRRFFGRGPWDELAVGWTEAYPVPPGDALPLRESLDRLGRLVDAILLDGYRAFGGRALADLVDPGRVKPEALAELERSAGPALYRSSDWLWREGLRLLALSGLHVATAPQRAKETLALQAEWMQRLGGLAQAA
jgi:hypothetical protein